MAGPTAADVLGRVTLVAGPEEFLNERNIIAVRAAVRGHDADAEVSEAMAADLVPASLGELAAPSLFSSTRCVVVRELERLPDDAADGLLAYAGAPADDVALVLAHGGGQKGSGLLAKLRKLDTVNDVRSQALRGGDFPRFVAEEVRALGSQIERTAADQLVQAVGQDLRGLASACHQLVNDFPGERLDDEHVRRYFGGRAEAKSFTVADHAFAGRRGPALEELRWALDAGTSPVLVTSAFASGARSLARFVSSQAHRDADLARDAGVPPWKVRILKEQRRGWDTAALASAIRAVAVADADVKGAAHDAAYTLERLVLTITGLQQR